MDCSVKKICEGIYQIKEYDDVNHVYMYLVVGSKKALLIDAGFGTFDLGKVVRELTDLPVEVVLTHGHYDHTGGGKYFDKVIIHMEDEGLLREHYEGTVEYLSKDSVFDLGDRKITVIPVPGHSGGSVCFYDGKENILFTGDTACEGDVLLLFPTSTKPEIYLESMKNLWVFMEEKNITVTWPAHHRCPIEPSIIEEFIEMTELLIEGKIELKDEINNFGPCKHGWHKRIGVLI